MSRTGIVVLIAAVLIVAVAAIMKANTRVSETAQKCIDRGGEPIVIHGQMVCFSKGTIIK